MLPLCVTMPPSGRHKSSPLPDTAELLDICSDAPLLIAQLVFCKQIAPPLDVVATFPVITVVPPLITSVPQQTAPPPSVVPPAVFPVNTQVSNVNRPEEELVVTAPPNAAAALFSKTQFAKVQFAFGPTKQIAPPAPFEAVVAKFRLKVVLWTDTLQQTPLSPFP